MFTRDGSVLFRNEMKPFYWLEMTLVQKLTNESASFHLNEILDSKRSITLISITRVGFLFENNESIAIKQQKSKSMPSLSKIYPMLKKKKRVVGEG